MPDILQNLALGASVAATPENLFYCFLGALVGTLIGVLPGLGPVTTIAMLLPLTFSLPAASALIMLAGIYYGSQYGGSTTAILVNMPGENSSVVTCLDGYQMAQQGRAGPALAIAALGSLFGGCVATLLIMVVAAPLASVAELFGAAEYFSLIVLGMVASVIVAKGSAAKALGMILLGLFLSTIGSTVGSALPRMTFGIRELNDGIGFVPLAMGLFAVAEILSNMGKSEDRSVVSGHLGRLLPTRDDLRRTAPGAVRSALLGSFLGLLPGGGATISSYAAYSLEKRLSRTPERFGKGAVEGVAAPETANNAGAQSSFIPLLTLGIPENAVMALMAGAMIIQGIQPGPDVMARNPELFWGLIMSMWVGNLMLVIINLPLIGLWVRLLKVPYRLFAPVLLVLCCIGIYSLNNSMFEVLLLAVFGLLGYILRRWGCEPGPLILAFVLGPLLEENLQRALVLSNGNVSTFVTHPLSATFLTVAAGLVLMMVLPSLRRVGARQWKRPGHDGDSDQPP